MGRRRQDRGRNEKHTTPIARSEPLAALGSFRRPKTAKAETQLAGTLSRCSKRVHVAQVCARVASLAVIGVAGGWRKTSAKGAAVCLGEKTRSLARAIRSVDLPTNVLMKSGGDAPRCHYQGATRCGACCERAQAAGRNNSLSSRVVGHAAEKSARARAHPRKKFFSS